jgi:mevalonate kinase
VAVGTGFGKLILFGEHAAVYGEPALGVSLPLETTVRIDAQSRGGVQLEGLDAGDTARFLELRTFIDGLALDVAFPDHCSISIASNVPRAAGLGSSAAFSTALVTALADAAEPPALDRDSLWRNANEIERFFHGTPSGIDTGLALLGGINALYPSPPSIPKWRGLAGVPLTLVVGTVQREGSTKALVGAIGERIRSEDPATVAGIGELGAISRRAIELFDAPEGSQPAIAEICELAERAQTTLCALGLGSDLLDSVLETGRRLGARAGKLSGAGGGGAFYLIVEELDAAYRCSTGIGRWARERNVPVRIHGVFSLEGGRVADRS